MTGGFVRAARASDAAGLARVQAASWSATLAELVPDEVLTELTSYAALDQFTERWLEAIISPPTSKHRVHVAVAEPGSAEVAGFAAAGPATDEDLWAGTDAELYELHVSAGARLGRAMSLPVTTADCCTRSRTRSPRTGSAPPTPGRCRATKSRIAFLTSAGWAPDGSTSNLDMGVKVPVIRLHTQLSPPSPTPHPSPA